MSDAKKRLAVLIETLLLSGPCLCAIKGNLVFFPANIPDSALSGSLQRWERSVLSLSLPLSLSVPHRLSGSIKRQRNKSGRDHTAPWSADQTSAMQRWCCVAYWWDTLNFSELTGAPLGRRGRLGGRKIIDLNLSVLQRPYETLTRSHAAIRWRLQAGNTGCVRLKNCLIVFRSRSTALCGLWSWNF